MQKRGQGEQFNWIFVIVAGSIILGFFVMFTFKYIELQEKRQDVDTVRFFGKGVLSAASKLQIGSGGAAVDSQGDEGLRFGYPLKLGYECNENNALILINEGKDAWYKLEDEIVFINDKVELNSLDGLDLWILPWNYPFHVTNFIYLANSKDKFYFIYDHSSSDFVNNELEISSVFDIEIEQRNQLEIKDNSKVVYFTNSRPSISEIISLNNNFKNLDFVYVNLQSNEVSFFTEEEWSESIKYFSIEQLYGAIFSNDQENYKCNIERSLGRTKIVAKIYSERAKLLGQIDRRPGCQYSNIANALARYAEGNFELEEVIKQQNLEGAGCIWVF